MSLENEAIPLVGPGDRVKAERIKQGLSIEDVSGHLHLAKRIVERLESNAFDELPARVFVVGYLRSYARYLKISEEEILAQFNSMCPQDDCALLPSVASNIKPEMRSSHGVIRLISWSLGLGFLALVTYWVTVNGPTFSFSMADYTDVANGPSVAETAETAAPEITMPMLESSTEPTLSETAFEPAVVEQLVTEVATAETIEQGNELTTSVTEVTEADTDMAEKPDTAQTTFVPVDTEEARVKVETLMPETKPAADVVVDKAVNKEITVKVNGKCWVDIRDSSRKFKLFGQMEKGMEEVLGGLPPYKVVLGDFRQVEITIGGKAYNLKQHAKGNVARFTLTP